MAEKTGGAREKILSLLFFCLALSGAFFSWKLFDSFQLAKAAGWLFFTLCSLFLALLGVKKYRINYVFYTFAAFFIYTSLRVAFSKANPEFYYWLALLSCSCFFVPVYTKISISSFLSLINLLSLSSGVFGLFQFLSGVDRPYSFYGNPIFFGETCAMFLPLIIASFFYFEKNRLYYLFNALFCLSSILLASSRGVFLSLLIVLPLLACMLAFSGFISLKSSKNKTLYIAAVLVFMLILGLIPGFIPAVRYAFKRNMSALTPDNREMASRSLMAKTALSMARVNPVLGLGPGGFKYFHPKYQSRFLKENESLDYISTSYAHNDYLQLAVEGGLAGLLLFAGFVLSLAFYYQKIYPYLYDRERAASAGLLCSLVFTLLEGFFNFPLSVLPQAMYFWLFSGVLYSLLLNADDPLPEAVGKKSAFVTAAVILLIIAPLLARPFDLISNFYLKSAVVSDSGNSPAYDGEFKRALSLNPSSFAAAAKYADACMRSRKVTTAAEYYNRALYVYPYTADMLYNAGQAQFILTDYAAAENSFKEAVSLYPAFPPAHLMLGKLYIKTGRDDESAGEFALAQKNDPGILERDTSGSVVEFKEITPGD